MKKSAPKKKVETNTVKVEEKIIPVEIEEVRNEEIIGAVENAIKETSAPAVKETVAEKPIGSLEKEPELAPVRTLEKITESGEREGSGYTNLGGRLPYYLL